MRLRALSISLNIDHHIFFKANLTLYRNLCIDLIIWNIFHCCNLRLCSSFSDLFGTSGEHQQQATGGQQQQQQGAQQRSATLPSSGKKKVSLSVSGTSGASGASENAAAEDTSDSSTFGPTSIAQSSSCFPWTKTSSLVNVPPFAHTVYVWNYM